MDEKSCAAFFLCDPASTSNKLVRNKWEENTHTHTHFVWRVRRTFFPSQWCFSTRAGFLTSVYMRIQSINQTETGGATLHKERPCRNGSSSILTPYREQPRITRMVVAYPRPGFSATKTTNRAPKKSRHNTLEQTYSRTIWRYYYNFSAAVQYRTERKQSTLRVLCTGSICRDFIRVQSGTRKKLWLLLYSSYVVFVFI